MKHGRVRMSGTANVHLDVEFTVATGLRLMEDWKKIREVYRELIKTPPSSREIQFDDEAIPTLDAFMRQLASRIEPDAWHPEDEMDEHEDDE